MHCVVLSHMVVSAIKLLRINESFQIPLMQHKVVIKNCLVSVAVKYTALAAGELGFASQPVKSHRASPTTRHHSNVFYGAVLPRR